MKIAVFTDIHGNLQALQSILDDIKDNNIDEIVCLGDVIAIGPNPKECLDLIINNKVNMILGNHELYYLKGTSIDDEMGESEIEHQCWVKNQLEEKHKDFLSSCSMKIEKNIFNKKILFQHFLIDYNSKDEYPFEDLNIVKDGSIEEKLQNINEDLIFIGHEHRPFEINIESKKLVDVGSSGCRIDNTTFYTIITINDNQISIDKKYLTYDRNKTIDTLLKTEYPDKKDISKIFFGLNI